MTYFLSVNDIVDVTVMCHCKSADLSLLRAAKCHYPKTMSVTSVAWERKPSSFWQTGSVHDKKMSQFWWACRVSTSTLTGHTRWFRHRTCCLNTQQYVAMPAGSSIWFWDPDTCLLLKCFKHVIFLIHCSVRVGLSDLLFQQQPEGVFRQQITTDRPGKHFKLKWLF